MKLTLEQRHDPPCLHVSVNPQGYCHECSALVFNAAERLTLNDYLTAKGGVPHFSPTTLMTTGAQDVLDNLVGELAEDFSVLSHASRMHAEDFATPAEAKDYQDRVERAILAYLELRCACGRARTAGPCCPVCAAGRAASETARRATP